MTYQQPEDQIESMTREIAKLRELVAALRGLLADHRVAEYPMKIRSLKVDLGIE